MIEQDIFATYREPLAFLGISQFEGAKSRDIGMKFNKEEIQLARAKYCVSQAALTKDEEIKKFWEDLANEWLEIDTRARGQNISHSGASNP